LEKEAANLKSWEAELKRREPQLKRSEAELKEAEAHLDKLRAAAAAQRAFKFPLVAPDVALRQLGALARLKRFEVPTRALEEAEQHVRQLRDLFSTDWVQVARRECGIPNLVVVARAGSGKTTLLRYLQQTADTVRYGAELQADTNWVSNGWTSAPCSGVIKDATRRVPSLRHVFVGFAAFKGGDMSFNASVDTEAAIQRRCAWRLLYDAGLAPDWTSNFDLDLAQAAEMLRAKISAAKGCTPDEVAIVFLVDEVTNIPEGPRCALRDAIAAWQRWEFLDGHLSFSVVSVSLSVGAEQLRSDEWFNCELPMAALSVCPLVEIPEELKAEVANSDSFADLDNRRWRNLIGNFTLARPPTDAGRHRASGGGFGRSEEEAVRMRWGPSPAAVG
jgi:hypothetical protein